MKFVTITNGGITQSVPEADVPLYLRAGYSVVGAKPEPVAPPVDPTPEPVDPEPVAPVADPVKSKKSDK